MGPKLNFHSRVTKCVSIPQIGNLKTVSTDNKILHIKYSDEIERA
jgi:hypothetical protein